MSQLRVARDCYVILEYALYDDEGELIDATDAEGRTPIGYVQGYGSLVPGLEQGLVGMGAGETREIEVSPEFGYGPRDPAKEHWVDRSEFPPSVEVEDEFAATDEQGEECTVRIVEITDDAILVDTNHPLAGETLRFDVIVHGVRPATAGELAMARARAPRPRLAVLGRDDVSPQAPVTPPPTGGGGAHGKERLRERTASMSSLDDDEQ